MAVVGQFLYLPPAGTGGVDLIITPAGTNPAFSTGSTTLTLTSSNASITITGNSSTNTIDLITSGGGGAGTVTSVALSLPSIFTVSGSPVTTTGTLTGTFNTQAANLFFAGPAAGGAATPTFRAVAVADIPTLNQNTTGTASNVTGIVAVANGGTGLSAGTSGGIPYYSGTATIASSGALTASRLVLGGGAGAAPTVLGSLGTTTTVLHGNAAGAPIFGAVSLTADVSSILPLANGGTELDNSITPLSAVGDVIAMPVATSVIRYVTGATTNIRGIASNGRALRISILVGGVGLTLFDADTSALAANRINLPDGANRFIAAGRTVTLIYDTVPSKWNLDEFPSPLLITGISGAQNLFSTISGAPTGSSNVILGQGANGNHAATVTGSVLIGYKTGESLGGSVSNLVAIGNQAAQSLSSSGGVYIGTAAGQAATVGPNVYIGDSAGANHTTGYNNLGVGIGALQGLTTGTNSGGIGNSSGQNFTTGDAAWAIGPNSGATTAGLSNVWSIGKSAKVSASNQMVLGGDAFPVKIGTGGQINPVYDIDNIGDINTTGNYRINGTIFSPAGFWKTTGNTLVGSEFIGTLNYYDLSVVTNSLPVIKVRGSGLTGFQQVSPTAVAQFGLFPGTIGDPASLGAAIGTIHAAASGYAFGSGNKNYSQYAFLGVSGIDVYSVTPSTTTFTEPATTDYDPTLATATPQSGSGYDGDIDTPPTYAIWALFDGGAIQSVNTAVPSGFAWPGSGFWDVQIDCTAPTGEAAYGYYIARNATDYQIVVGSTCTLLDNNTGWVAGAAPGLPDVAASFYNVVLTPSSVTGADGYRYLNTTTGTFVNNVTTDDNTWASGSTVTPTSAYYESLRVDGATALTGLKTAIRTVTTDDTATLLDYAILADAIGGNIIETLPPAATCSGLILVVKKIDPSSNTVTLDGDSSETIDGATTQVISIQWNSFMVQSNGTAWFII